MYEFVIQIDICLAVVASTNYIITVCIVKVDVTKIFYLSVTHRIVTYKQICFDPLSPFFISLESMKSMSMEDVSTRVLEKK